MLRPSPAPTLARTTSWCAHLFWTALLCAAGALPAAAQASSEPDSAAFITRLGRDTLAVERWVRSRDRVTAEAAVRMPETTLRTYTLHFAPDGTLQRYEASVFEGADHRGAPARTEVVEAAGAGTWARTVMEEGAEQTEEVAAGPSLLPFIDLVFWPYELASVHAAGQTPMEQPLLMGNRVLPFTVEQTAPDSVTITHPYRGPSVAAVDDAGRIRSLDASATTRKVTVTRVPWVDVAQHARRWGAADEAGRGIGELSGRGTEEADVAAAHLTVDYGVPSKRGRDIFGNVVPWNTLWRTGANRATHFTTDRALVLGDPATGTLDVPAGTYTLFSILAPDGGQLIVNRQTNQNGMAYDAAQDLGRVALQRTQHDEPVEQFTIEVEPTAGDGGVLRLVWDRSAFSVPFTVK
jgi:hypothetical protein